MKRPTFMFNNVVFYRKDDAKLSSSCERCVLRGTRICAEEARHSCGAVTNYFVVKPTPVNLDRWALLKLKGEI